MLRNLLLRDALLHGRMLLISYAFFLAFQGYFLLNVDSARMWLVFSAIYAAFLSISVFAREDKFRSTAWTCTLPVNRREIVGSRFLGAWLLVAGALAVAALAAALLPGSRVRVADLAQVDTLLLTATVITLILASMVPFLIRFGLLGMMIFLVGAQLLGAAVLLIAIARKSQGGRSPIGVAFSVIAGGVRAAHDALPAVAFQLLVVALLVALNWAGYRFAALLFRRREL